MPRYRSILGTCLALAAVVGLAVVSPSVAWSQGEGDESQNSASGSSDDAEETSSASDKPEVKRSRTIRLDKYGTQLERPVGWVRATPGDGAALTLRAAGDKNAQIEVRISSPVPERRRDSYFGAFHSSLEEAGFNQTASPKSSKHGGHTGRWTRYAGSSERGTFQLVVWQFYRNETAWLFVGFFPEHRADAYTEEFESLLASLAFD